MHLTAVKIALTSALLALTTTVVSVVFVEDLMLSSILMSVVGGLGILMILFALIAIWTLK